MEQFREFLMRAAHDLRSPVRSLRTGAELLQSPEKRNGPELEQILSFMMEGARKLDSLVDGLSNLAVAMSSKQSGFRPTRIDVVLRSAIARLRDPIRESGAEVRYGDLPTVTGDPDRLTQLFENLLRNAIQHRGDQPPVIEIQAEAGDGTWRFAVQDNGPGVEPEYLDRIFRPFERLTRTGPGSGLGLAICREIVARHRGRIWAASQAGAGTTIYFTLPADAG